MKINSINTQNTFNGFRPQDLKHMETIINKRLTNLRNLGVSTTNETKAASILLDPKYTEGCDIYFERSKTGEPLDVLHIVSEKGSKTSIYGFSEYSFKDILTQVKSIIDGRYEVAKQLLLRHLWEYIRKIPEKSLLMARTFMIT